MEPTLEDKLDEVVPDNVGDTNEETIVSESPPADANKLIREVAAIAESIEYEGRVLECTLSSGVVLACKPVPPLAMREVAIHVPPPAVPTWHNPDKDREEPNPNDPAYIKAVENYQAEQLFKVTEVIMLLGTEIKSTPPDIIAYTSDDWLGPLTVLGVIVDEPKNKWERYLMWLRFYACKTQSDVANIIGRVVAVSGVTEVEVQRAAAAFLRTAGR